MCEHGLWAENCFRCVMSRPRSGQDARRGADSGSQNSTTTALKSLGTSNTVFRHGRAGKERPSASRTVRAATEGSGACPRVPRPAKASGGLMATAEGLCPACGFHVTVPLPVEPLFNREEMCALVPVKASSLLTG